MLRKLSYLLLLLQLPPSLAEQIVLHQNSIEHIHFRRIQPTVVSFEKGVVHFDVNKSASFLLLAFDEIKHVRTVSFQWKANGMLNKTSDEQKKTRKGDDAWLRLGLIISGQPGLVPGPLLPRWVQQVRQTLKHPSERMVYLIPGARNTPGETWKSPFSSNIDIISVESHHRPDGWKQVTHVFTEPQRTVGLWLMADGDNTDSIFNSQLRNLVIE